MIYCISSFYWFFFLVDFWFSHLFFVPSKPKNLVMFLDIHCITCIVECLFKSVSCVSNDWKVRSCGTNCLDFARRVCVHIGRRGRSVWQAIVSRSNSWCAITILYGIAIFHFCWVCLCFFHIFFLNIFSFWNTIISYFLADTIMLIIFRIPQWQPVLIHHILATIGCFGILVCREVESKRFIDACSYLQGPYVQYAYIGIVLFLTEFTNPFNNADFFFRQVSNWYIYISNINWLFILSLLFLLFFFNIRMILLLIFNVYFVIFKISHL